MRVPEGLRPLVELGVIDEVERPLMSGKEAQVFLVVCGGERRVAKVYKEATNRSFKHRAEYTEGRRVRNSRQQRAMDKKSRFGREQVESAWRSAEVDAIYRLVEAGVRVPHPYDFVENVLVMELVADANGDPAPRLVDVDLTEDEALNLFDILLREIVKMTCAGLVHGDLSDFNVLLGTTGPVLIDFPQAVDTAHNRNAGRLLVRDVNNITSFLARFAPALRKKRFGEEMWDLYERNELTPESRLTGKFRRRKGQADTNALLAEIEAMEQESRAKREALGLPPPRARAPKPALVSPPRPAAPSQQPAEGGRKRRRRRGKRDAAAAPVEARAPAQGPALAPLDDLDALLLVEDTPVGPARRR